MTTPSHDHDDLRAIDHDAHPGELMRAFLEHVRDVHGHVVDSKTPWIKVQNLHREDHA
jgi:hypothetical protein